MTNGRDKKLNLLFWVLVTTATLIRGLLASHLGLGDDEAYYWEWARHLDISYYDHPGMTAWLIALSRNVLGDTSFAVRFPSLVLNTAGWILVWQLTLELFGAGAAFVAGTLYFLIPLYGLGGMMMVPDIPMSFFWLIFLLLSLKVAREKATPATWVALGLVSALGTLSKYTMALAPFSLFIFLMVSEKRRPILKTVWPWISVIVWILGLFPIAVWNSKHQWASLGFQITGRLHAGGSGLSLGRWLAFWATQIGFLTIPVFALFTVAVIKAIKKTDDVRWQFVLCFSLPTLGLFEFQALLSEFKPHWPAPGYLALLCGAAFLYFENWRRWRVLTALMIIFLIPLNVLIYVDTVVPIVPKIYRSLNLSQPWNPQFDPFNDLYGWPAAAAHVRELQRHFPSAFVATHRYQLTSQLAFAMGDKVWNLTPSREGYDFFQTPDELRQLSGKDAIVVADNRFEDTLHTGKAFTSCEELPSIEVPRRGETAKVFSFFHCERLRPHWVEKLISRKLKPPGRDNEVIMD